MKMGEMGFKSIAQTRKGNLAATVVRYILDQAKKEGTKNSGIYRRNTKNDSKV